MPLWNTSLMPQKAIGVEEKKQNLRNIGVVVLDILEK
jgi:hypothetical protein